MTQHPAKQERECRCTHADAITCLAQSLRTTRFNAMLLKGKGDIDAGLGGYCTCPCHRGAAHQMPPKNRNTGKNFAKKSEVLS